VTTPPLFPVPFDPRRATEGEWAGEWGEGARGEGETEEVALSPLSAPSDATGLPLPLPSDAPPLPSGEAPADFPRHPGERHLPPPPGLLGEDWRSLLSVLLRVDSRANSTSNSVHARSSSRGSEIG